MKIDDRIIYYEVSKQLPKSTQNTTELNREKQLPDEQKSAGKAESGQDTIVNLSQALKETQLAKEIIASEPDIREDKRSNPEHIPLTTMPLRISLLILLLTKFFKHIFLLNKTGGYNLPPIFLPA